jgi:methionyl-tRNA formyltransferase
MTATIGPDDTAGSLLTRLASDGAGLLVTTFDGLEDGVLEARPQAADGLSYAPKLTVDDALVDWTKPAAVVDAHIRGCIPAPGAWTTVLGGRLKLEPVRARPDDARLEPGEVRASKADVLVGTGTSPVALTRVQAQGKPWMPAADWARGLRDDPGRLGE